MTKQLNIYFESINEDATADTLVAYALFEGGQVCNAGSASLADLKSHITGLDSCDINAVIPGEQIVSLLIDKPNVTRRHLGQAIPYLLEDELASPVEILHIAYSESRTDNKLLCAVIDKGLLEGYLSLCSEASIDITRLLPDYWALPASDNLEVASRDERILIRISTSEGASFPSVKDVDILAALFRDDASELAGRLEEENIPDWQPGEIPDIPVNLLQGAYAPVRKSSSNEWLKPAGIAAGVGIAVFLGYFIAAGWYFNQQAEDLANESEALYRELFPNDKRIINIQRQMQVHLNTAGSNQNQSLFFDMLNAFSQAQTKQSEPSSIRNIRFNQEDTSLHLELQTTSINYANNLQGLIQKNGMMAEVLSANSNADGIIARLRIQPEDMQ